MKLRTIEWATVFGGAIVSAVIPPLGLRLIGKDSGHSPFVVAVFALAYAVYFAAIFYYYSNRPSCRSEMAYPLIGGLTVGSQTYALLQEPLAPIDALKMVCLGISGIFVIVFLSIRFSRRRREGRSTRADRG